MTYNFCLNRVSDLISFLVDETLISIYENFQTIENRCRITAVVALYEMIKIVIYTHNFCYDCAMRPNFYSERSRI